MPPSSRRTRSDIPEGRTGYSEEWGAFAFSDLTDCLLLSFVSIFTYPSVSHSSFCRLICRETLKTARSLAELFFLRLWTDAPSSCVLCGEGTSALGSGGFLSAVCQPDFL
ncbi:hypothetical protein CSUI_010240, partial [Cystoisospora suis]